MRCLILVSNDVLLNRQKIVDYLDTVPELKNWRATNGAVFIATEMDENWLAQQIHKAFPEMHFMVTPVQIETVQGYQDAGTWDFIRNPRPA